MLTRRPVMPAREALDLGPGTKLRWKVRGGTVSITTERPALYALQGFIKQGPNWRRRRGSRAGWHSDREDAGRLIEPPRFPIRGSPST